MSWQAVVLSIFGGFVVLGVIAIIAVLGGSKASDTIKREMMKDDDGNETKDGRDV